MTPEQELAQLSADLFTAHKSAGCANLAGTEPECCYICAGIVALDEVLR